MVDVQETPAVAPEESGGDERAGLQIAGAVLITLGWGFGVFLNVLLHASARSGGRVIGSIRIFSTLGPYAEAVLGFGLVTGAIGVAFLWLARDVRAGPLRLPGTSY
jgi:hypothetical protein